MTEHRNVSRGLGNQVTVEFNLLYRFHCAISQKDEKFTEDFMKETMREKSLSNQGPETLSPREFDLLTRKMSQATTAEPWLQEFGLKNSDTQSFKRNTITGLFDDQQIVNQLLISMDDPICKYLLCIQCSDSKNTLSFSEFWAQKCSQSS